jgi:hypothetical protein
VFLPKGRKIGAHILTDGLSLEKLPKPRSGIGKQYVVDEIERCGCAFDVE